MSQRTVIEINHDLCHRVEKAEGGLEAALSRALASAMTEHWDVLRQFGITKITQCHHSEDRKVVVNKREYPFG